MKRVRVIAGVAIGLLVVASFVVAFLRPSPVDVARRHCSEKGLPVENLVGLGYRGSGGLLGFGNRETVEFQVKGADRANKVVAELRQPAYFLPWRGGEFREEAQP
jgi:hypothetical protein